MKGIHKVVVGTKYLKYEFELRRNLTIIRGDSATGKTTLVDMIRTHMNDGESGPVTLNCDKSCYVVEGNLWKGQLNSIQDSIVFIDEGNRFLVSKKFADTLASKYKEESEPKINTIPDLNVEAAVNTPAEFILGSETKESNEDLLNKTIEIPTFEELQARNKNIESVILNSKPENNVVPLEEFKMPEEKVEEKIEEPEAIKTNYKER